MNTSKRPLATWISLMSFMFPVMATVLVATATSKAASQDYSYIEAITASSKFSDSISTVEVLTIAEREILERVEVLTAPSTAEQYQYVTRSNSSPQDWLVVVKRPGAAVQELRSYQVEITNGLAGVSLVDTLLQFPMAAKELRSVWTGDLDSDATRDIVTLEQGSQDIVPRLWHYQWTGIGPLLSPNEITVPIPPAEQPARDLIAMTFGNLDGMGDLDLVTIERDEVGNVATTYVNHYSYAAGVVTFQRQLFAAESWLHDFLDVAIGSINPDGSSNLLLVDSLLYDSTNQIQHWQVTPGGTFLQEFLLITIPVEERLHAANSITTIVPDDLTGDYNTNGEVDAADYVIWRKTLGGTNPAADGNGDGIVNLFDYVVWRTHFGETAGNGSIANTSAVVPEPAFMVLMIMGIAATCGFQRATRFSPRRALPLPLQL